MSTNLKDLENHVDNVIGALEQFRSYLKKEIGSDETKDEAVEEKTKAKKARATKPKPEPEVVEDESDEEDDKSDEEDDKSDEPDDEPDDESEISIDVVRELAGQMIKDGVVKRLDVVRMVKKLGGSKMNDLDQDALQSLYNQLRKKQG